MSAPLLRAEGLGKAYRRRAERSLLLGRLSGRRPVDTWALRDARLEVSAGEVVAAIGRNGAGKSTLLKLASGVTRPTEGTLVRPDSVAPLIEVGAGFHPDLSGRENVEINARLLGMTAAQTRRRFDDIVEFADLAQAIDQPVRQYSSGMYMRLGFSVAVHTRPQLLVVDEVLAVGDLPFQVKCLERIRELKDQGAGVLFVSHNLTAVLNLADRALLLDRGTTLRTGPVDEVVAAYHSMLADLVADGLGEDAGTSGELAVEELALTRPDGPAPGLWTVGDTARMTLRLRAGRDLAGGGLVGFRVAKEGAGVVARWHATDDGLPPMHEGEVVEVSLDIDLNVGEGRYTLECAVARGDWSVVMVNHRPVPFAVAPRPGGSGLVDVAPRLRIASR